MRNTVKIYHKMYSKSNKQIWLKSETGWNHKSTIVDDVTKI